MKLTIASYNVHSGIGTDGRFDLHRVAEVIREIAPDVAALQEVGDFRGVTGHDEHPEELSAMLGMHLAFGPNVVIGGRRYGNAILSRLPILKSRNYDISLAGREPRGALRCDLDLGERRTLHVFCLHLGLSFGERRRQEALLLSADILRDAVRADPVVVCGDFNYWWTGAVPALVRRSIHDAALSVRERARTYPSRLPWLRLDRIYVDEGVRPLSVRAQRTPLTQHASDHLPLVMECETPIGERLSPTGPVQLVG